EDGSKSRWWFASDDLMAAPEPRATITGAWRKAPWRPGSLESFLAGGARITSIAETIKKPEPQKPQAYIVVSDEGAATHPKKHDGRGAAEAEAARLAMKHPGIGFTVYHAVSRAHTAPLSAELTILDKAA